MTNNETPFMDIVKANVTELYCAEEADNLIKSPELVGCVKYSPQVQRGLVNRVLINKLLIFRATHKVSVVDVIYCLLPDGDNEAWMNVFKLVVLPFLKQNKVKL